MNYYHCQCLLKSHLIRNDRPLLFLKLGCPLPCTPSSGRVLVLPCDDEVSDVVRKKVSVGSVIPGVWEPSFFAPVSVPIHSRVSTASDVTQTNPKRDVCNVKISPDLQ